ncbi:hypothetical protein [Duganella sp. HH105]|uniref:hypothetical protein n=1 Tax=Duganella sp. HH105 TaxID=1781067 RepID=UPI000877B575|nr:hypothetical protein [Duganella sp. HH105]OEZ55378.1 hypothetical protein DUGA6_54500 [Duganella sp. HH105]
MNAPSIGAVPPAAYTELLDYLRQSGSTLSPAEAIVSALKQWIAAGRTLAAPVRGYQWKCLFLPEATRVRMKYRDDYHHAEVVGDELIFRGEAVSPRRMTMEIAGDGRNAWRDLWVRLPGERHWANAALLRARLERQAALPQPTPATAMSAAVKTMSDALNAALMLIEHVDHQTKTMSERRLPKHRRADDTLTDDH